MLTIVSSGLLRRWASLLGAFAALALGVGLITAMGQVLAAAVDRPAREPVRYAAAATVVTAVDELRVPTAHGGDSQPLAAPAGLSDADLARLRTAGPVTPDRVIPLGTDDGAGTGRPWPAAAQGRHGPLRGTAPENDGEVVDATGTSDLGDRITVYLPDRGPATYLVVGTVDADEAELYFTADEAARLSPRIDAVIVDADADRVRAIAGPGLRVYSGAELSRFDPATRRDSEALIAASALVGTAGGVAGFVSVFIVASVFAFSVDQRRREFALLRTAGATPGQIRHSVLTEATVLGTVAAATGCLLGEAGAPGIAAWLRDLGMAPEWFEVSASHVPAVIAAATGLVVAVCGAIAAARRAARVHPAEALRSAAPGGRALTWPRAVAGCAALAGMLAMLLPPLFTDPSMLLKRKQYVPMVMLALLAFSLLAPVLVPPIARGLTWPLLKLRGATGLLARETALGSARRTAATAAPVFLTVGLAVGLLGFAATIEHARTTEETDLVTADFLIEAGPAPAVDPAAVAALEQVPGTVTATVGSTTVYDLEEDTALLARTAHAVDPAALGELIDLPVISGSVHDLDDTSIIVDTEWHRRPGDVVHVWLADGTPVRLTVAAVIRQGAGGNGAYVTPANAPGAEVDRVLVSAAPGGAPATVEPALRRIAGAHGTVVTDRAAWAAANAPTESSPSRVGMRVVLGLALAYAGVFAVATLVMATRERVGELRALRLSGATRGQVLRVLGAESALVALFGTALAFLGCGGLLAGLWLALRRLTGTAVIVLPWDTIIPIVSACAVGSTTVVIAVALGTARRWRMD